MNYVILRQWTDGKNKRWFTVQFSNGTTSTHCITV